MLKMAGRWVMAVILQECWLRPIKAPNGAKEFYCYCSSDFFPDHQCQHRFAAAKKVFIANATGEDLVATGPATNFYKTVLCGDEKAGAVWNLWTLHQKRIGF